MMTGFAPSLCAVSLLQGLPQLLVCFLLFDLQRQNQIEVSVKCSFEVELARESQLEQVLWAILLLPADVV